MSAKLKKKWFPILDCYNEIKKNLQLKLAKDVFGLVLILMLPFQRPLIINCAIKVSVEM